MPLGWDRLNERTSRPNPHIVFIKPLPGPDEAVAKDFLERVAAICVPIMKANYIAVASLAEHEPNKEFLGRNFNNGEVIELVLKSHSGHWLPFQFVQMVMMHELAHCKQMNHSKAFWAVRNQYATELRALWGRGYVGEGIWGRGQPLNGQYSPETGMPKGEIPEHLCGGGFRSRGGTKRKRSEKPKKTYAEKKEARIQKKFGKAGAGVALGGDLGMRSQLEKGKKVSYGTPRGTQTNRSRDLRLQAILARQGQSSINPAPEEDDEVKSESASDTESETEDEEDSKDVVDRHGRKILDKEGRPMVRVCEDEDVGSDPNAQAEFRELGHIQEEPPPRKTKTSPINANTVFKLSDDAGKAALPFIKKRPVRFEPSQIHVDEDEVSTASEDEDDAKASSLKSSYAALPSSLSTKNSSVESSTPSQCRSIPVVMSTPFKSSEPTRLQLPSESISSKSLASDEAATTPAVPEMVDTSQKALSCGVCTTENDPEALICMICSNVLDLERLPNYWYCKHMECRGSVYVNHGDSGRCGLCGNPRQVVKWDD